ncbi:MAG: TldD/PmbA family protein [Dehalococcoidia bacterium]|nr:TldD/PmbA family protein [Dehalococcoidia bacterium]
MRDRISEALKGHAADYIEVRLQEGESTHIGFRGREMDSIGSSANNGGCVRAQAKGGWGFVSFDNLSNLRSRVEMAVSQARLVGKGTSELSPVKPSVSETDAVVKKNPAAISLVDKKRLLDEYNDIIWSTEGVQTSIIGYANSQRNTVFANSEGSYIRQGRVDVTMRLVVVARDGGEVQQVGMSIGSKGDFSVVEGLHDEVKASARRAVEMLSAPRVSGDKYTVVLDPVLAGVFVHEAFGHLSEADFTYENERLRELMLLGRRFGGKHLNIVDDASMQGLRGSYEYDDEGTPSSKVYLIREGILTGRLHSRETAAKMGERPTGNARAINYHYPPIVRMGNTFIEPGVASFDELVADIKDGIYAKNWYGGTTSMEMFTFSAGESYMIRNGKVEELVRPVTLSGNVFDTLANIDAIGSDLEMNEGGGCGKGGQFPLPVSNGSPHIRLRNCLVGGG